MLLVTNSGAHILYLFFGDTQPVLSHQQFLHTNFESFLAMFNLLTCLNTSFTACDVLSRPLLQSSDTGSTVLGLFFAMEFVYFHWTDFQHK